MVTNPATENRKAIEALRAGVPNRDAVRVMGSSQAKLEGIFREKLANAPGVFQSGEQLPGLLIAGDFGNGKSHLLEYFKHVALENNFVCSKIVISKETPLYDPGKVFRAAIEAARVPGILGSAMTDIASQLNFDSQQYRDFFLWLQGGNTGLSEWFGASLYLFEYAHRDQAIQEQMIRFWAGDRLQQGELKRFLKDCGQGVAYKIDKLSVKEAARQRFLFVPRLMMAAGYAGWVILADEMELMGRYSFKQRVKSYAEFARLLGKIDGDTLPGLTSVFSISADFESIVLEGKDDEEKIQLRSLSDTGADESLLGSRAQAGMRLIRKKHVLEKMDRETLYRSYQKLRGVYQQAYNWSPPDNFNQPDMTSRMRQHIKRWITEWDLKRLYPEYQPDIEVSLLNPDYSEDTELEAQEESGNDEENTIRQ